jgi:hypothetical protein
MFRYLTGIKPVQFVEILPLKASQEDSHGEFFYDKEFPEDDNIVERLAKHIEILAIIGNTNHRHRNFRKTQDMPASWKMLPGTENDITRVNQYEFSFYPKQPLTISKFDQLRKKITEIAKKCHPNLHLLLSSFPVEIENKLLNCVIYVECSDKPILTTMFKKHMQDKKYSYSKPFFPLSEVKKILSECNIRSECTFEFLTAGGTLVNVAVEICRDHLMGRAQESILRKLSHIESGEFKTSFSPWITHVITSNTVKIKDHFMLSDKVTKVDPIHARIVDKDKFLTYAEAPSIFIPYPKAIGTTKISAKFGNAIMVSSPPFGKDYTLYASREYSVGRFTNTLILKKLDAMLEPQRFVKLEDQYTKAISVYLRTKTRDQSRHESIQRISTLFKKLHENKTIGCVDTMLDRFLKEAENEQAKHSARFFKRQAESEYAELLKNNVIAFIKTENLTYLKC